jgi:hypothetical protein
VITKTGVFISFHLLSSRDRGWIVLVNSCYVHPGTVAMFLGGGREKSSLSLREWVFSVSLGKDATASLGVV